MAKKLKDQRRDEIVDIIKRMLHHSRHESRFKGLDTGKIEFDTDEQIYNQAVGFMLGMHALGYGFRGSMTDPLMHPKKGLNLNRWLEELEQEVLQEENFGGSNECDHCLKVFGEDGAGRKPWTKDKTVKVTPPHLRAQEEKAAAQKENKMKIHCVVACTNANGEPDFFGCVIEVTQEEYENGVHYDKARELASKEDYKAYLVYDERTDGPRWLFENMFEDVPKFQYPHFECPDCGEKIPDDAEPGDECKNCGHVFHGKQNND